MPRTGISSGTLRSAIEYGLPLLFLSHLRQTEDGTEQPRYADQHSRPVSRRRLLAQRVEYWSVVSGTRVPKHPGIYVRIPEYTAGRVLRNSGRRR